jgi:hypothetical protein
MAQQLPALEIAFRVNGLAEMKAAFKSIQDSVLNAEKAMTNATKTAVKDRSNAYADEAKWKAKLAKGVGEELAKSLDAETKKELAELKKREAAHKEHARRVGSFLGKSGGGSSGGSSIGGKAGASEAEAGISSAMGAAAIAGLAAAAIAAGAALTQFGGYLLNDVIKPALEVGRSAQQISNQLGGSATASELHKFIIDQSKDSGQSQQEVTAILQKAVENFGDPDKAKFATKMGIDAKLALGFDPSKTAAFLQNEWQKNPNASQDQMEAHLNAMITKVKQKTSSISAGELFNIGGKATQASSLFGGDSADAKNANSTALVGLLSVAKKSFSSTEEAASSQNHAFIAIKQHLGTAGSKYTDTNGNLIGSEQILKMLNTKTKGDLGKLEQAGLDPEAAKYFSFLLKSLNEDSRGFEKALKETTDVMNGDSTELAKQAQSMKDNDPATQLDKMKNELIAAFEPVAEVVRKDILPAMKAAMPGFINIIKNDLVPILEILGKTVGDLILMMLRVMKYVPGSGVEQKDINSFVSHMSTMDPTFARRHYSALDAEGKAIADKQQQDAIAAMNAPPLLDIQEKKNANGEVERLTFGVAVDKNSKALSDHAKLVDELTKSNYELANALSDNKPGFGVRRVANPIVTGVQ